MKIETAKPVRISGTTYVRVPKDVEDAFKDGIVLIIDKDTKRIIMLPVNAIKPHIEWALKT